MYQCLHKEAPELFLNLFSTKVIFMTMPLATQNYVPCGRLDVIQFSIIIQAANVWNSLPNQVKNAQSLQVFKQQFRNYFIEK